jgi:methyl-accepting chemotaxis protein
MSVSILAVALLAMAATVLYLGFSARRMALTEAQEKAFEIGGRWSATVQARIQTAMDAARTLAQALEGMKARGIPQRDMMDGILKNVLEKYPSILAVWTCWEPDALDNDDFKYQNAVGHDATGRFIPYWNRLHGDVDVEPLKDYTVEGLGDYYLIPKEAGREIVFDPVPYEIEGQKGLKTILAVPIQYGGEVIGVVGVDIPLRPFFEPIIKQVRGFFEEGYGFLMASNGVFAAHPTKWDNVGRPMEYFNFEPASIQAVKEGRQAEETKVSKTTGRKQFYAFSPITIGEAEKKWSLAITIPVDRITERANSIFAQSLGIGFIALIVVGAVVWFLIGRVTSPIVNMASTIRQVANERDLTLDVRVSSQDEIGIMAREFNNMMKALRQSFVLFDDAAGHVNAQAQEVAQRATANRDRAENDEKQMASVQKTVLEMGETAGEVQGSSNRQAEAATSSYSSVEQLIESMHEVNISSSEQIKEASTATERVAAMGETAQKVTATARNQSEQVAQVTDAMSQIAKSVEEMTKSAERATEQGRTVLNAAEEGRHTVDATVAGMQAIKDSSDQISDIIGVITDISEQTNLLALNAAIEAARAGVHGKGFAVVADEVGKLAQRSAEAAKEVTQLIKDSTSRVDEGTRLTDRSQEALRKIAQGGEINMRAIDEIAVSTQKLAGNTREVTQLVGELNKLAQDIVNMAGQQGQRREAAEKALAALVEKSNAISAQVTLATERAKSVGEEMRGVLDRSSDMKKMTEIQAGRSQTLREITTESTQRAKQTVDGAGEVVGITLEMQRLAANLARQVAQFKIKKGQSHSIPSIEEIAAPEIAKAIPAPVE